MIVSENISFKNVLIWSAPHLILLFVLSSSVCLLFYFEILNLKIPWLPVSVIGTAVAFYVGFKNNQSYDRMWEVRKIWGGIVNASRSWGIQVNGYVNTLFKESDEQIDVKAIKKKLIYRHIAWLYAHRAQLLKPTSWEHHKSYWKIFKGPGKLRKAGLDRFKAEHESISLADYLEGDELSELDVAANKATQIINQQSTDLEQLRAQSLIDDFRHVEMMQTLGGFYELQGKNERIKKFPLPRQYANISSYFTIIFILLLPFTLIPEIMDVGYLGWLVAAPITVVVSWVYVLMELVGYYSQNPFQGMTNDIPMLSLCRTIDIDLRQILEETELPDPIDAKNNVLM